ncbi:MAG TPA: tetratricopeptide repeat protein [Terracidiphilus sp.]|nr:tetratricopeptide repeat protein [Terracidiphilus sp.]
MMRLRGYLCLSASMLAAAAVLFPIPGAKAQTQVAALSSSDAPSISSKVDRPSLTPIEMGDFLVSQRRYQEAVDAYSESAEKTAAVWNRIGIAYQLMSNTSQAQRCYKQALKLDAADALALNNLGTIAASVDDYGEAERMVRKALKLDPRFATAYKNLGTILIAENKRKQGQEAYEKAMALNPDVFFTSNKLKIDNRAPVHDRGAMNYSIAAACARAGSVDCALRYLRSSLDEGYASPGEVARDKQFAGLAGNPEFRKLLAEQSGR